VVSDPRAFYRGTWADRPSIPEILVQTRVPLASSRKTRITEVRDVALIVVWTAFIGSIADDAIGAFLGIIALSTAYGLLRARPRAWLVWRLLWYTPEPEPGDFLDLPFRWPWRKGKAIAYAIVGPFSYTAAMIVGHHTGSATSASLIEVLRPATEIAATIIPSISDASEKMLARGFLARRDLVVHALAVSWIAMGVLLLPYPVALLFHPSTALSTGRKISVKWHALPKWKRTMFTFAGPFLCGMSFWSYPLAGPSVRRGLQPTSEYGLLITSLGLPLLGVLGISVAIGVVAYHLARRRSLPS
jgi:hypothetical protein